MQTDNDTYSHLAGNSYALLTIDAVTLLDTRSLTDDLKIAPRHDSVCHNFAMVINLPLSQFVYDHLVFLARMSRLEGAL